MLMIRTLLRQPWAYVAAALIAATALGTASASPRRGQQDDDALTRAVAFESALTGVAERVSPSVVSIRVEVNRPANNGLPFFFGGQGRGGIMRGGGSGVIIRSDGYVLTNNHVVAEATRIDVDLQNGKSYPAKLIGTDKASDLAILKIDARGLPQASFASSESARVGQFVIAIGSPFGLDYTVTTGVLSAKGRGGIGANEIEDYLQTDASINPGNSGGPLVDLQGHVLGINTMIIGRGSGIGFAIPSEIAQRVAEQLIANGEVRRAWLGVSFQEITPELASHFGRDFEGGALINGVVQGGPADRAGLRPGDVVTEVDGAEIRKGHDLLRSVLRHDVGERLALGVLREGSKKQMTVVAGERPNDGRAQSRNEEPRETGLLGLSLEDITPRMRERFRYEGEGNVVVSMVQGGSDADRAGLMRGDIVLQADRRPVRSVADVRAALSDGKALLYIERESRRFFKPVEKSN